MHPDSQTNPLEQAHSGQWSTLQWAGVAAAGAGAASLGVGVYFLASALAKKSDSSKDCAGDSCGDQGFAVRSSAVNRGDAATVFGVAGGLLVAGGITLFVVGRESEDKKSAESERGRVCWSIATFGLGARLLADF